MKTKQAFNLSRLFTPKIILLMLITAFSFLSSSSVNAQELKGNHKKEFKKYYEWGVFLMNNPKIKSDEYIVDSAIRTFLVCSAIEPDNADVNFDIGKLYLMTFMLKQAALPYCQKAVTEYNQNVPEAAMYVLARAEHIHYQFDQAITDFNTCKKMLLSDDAQIKDIDYWIACCNNAKELMQNPVDCRIVNMGDKVNGTYDDYGPVIVADESSMYFTSKRPGVENTDTSEFIWTTTSVPGGEWTEPKDPGMPLNKSGGNSATVSVSPDGQTLIMYHSGNATNGVIYSSTLTGNQWSDPEKVYLPNFEVAEDSHSGSAPGNIVSCNSSICTVEGSYSGSVPSGYLSTDGNTIYLNSGRAGGMGGKDIYKIDKGPDGKWGEPQNLGPKINTQYDEDAPFVSLDGSLLFFSSKGHNTMGGYDVFMSQKESDGQWGEPKNMGYPINTPDDDKYFTLTANCKKGYYNTVRLGAMGDRDLYEVVFNNPLPVKPLAVLVGYFKSPDGKPIPTDATITLTKDGKSLTRPINTSTGKFLQLMTPEQPYSIVITAGGKESFHHTYAAPMDSSYCTLGRAFYLGNIMLGDTTDVINNAKHTGPRPIPYVSQKFLKGPYYVKYFGYNLNNIVESDPDFGILVRNIKSLSSDRKILITIESSASYVPTTIDGTCDKSSLVCNKNLSQMRADAINKAIKNSVTDMSRIKIQMNPAMGGPAYANDSYNLAKYEKFQYVKIYIAPMPGELSAGTSH